MKILFLDDDEIRYQQLVRRLNGRCEVVWVKNRSEFETAIKCAPYQYDLIMLDHDLGLEDFTGEIAAKILKDIQFGDTQTIVIHSANPCGVQNMLSHLSGNKTIEVYAVGFAWSRIDIDGDRIDFL